MLLGLLGTTQADLDGIRPSDPNRATEAANQTQPSCVQGAVGGMCTGGSGKLPKSFKAIHLGEGGDGYGFNVDGIGLDAGSKGRRLR